MSVQSRGSGRDCAWGGSTVGLTSAVKPQFPKGYLHWGACSCFSLSCRTVSVLAFFGWTNTSVLPDPHICASSCSCESPRLLSVHTPHRTIRVYVQRYKPLHVCALCIQHRSTYVHTSAESKLKAKWGLGVKTKGEMLPFGVSSAGTVRC